MERKLYPIGKSSTGLNENDAALIAILLGWISGLIMFFVEKKSDFVKFHAMQILITFLGISIIKFFLGRIPEYGGLLSTITGIGGFGIWVLLFIKIHEGVWYELPFVGNLAMNIAGIPPSY